MYRKATGGGRVIFNTKFNHCKENKLKETDSKRRKVFGYYFYTATFTLLSRICVNAAVREQRVGQHRVIRGTEIYT